ncbi:MAG: 3-oxoacyl-[acyl-carrier-protein] reductase [Candidatus Omnitrophota bacterium]
MMNEFKGKTVIITGGSGGIGKACCLAFAQLGANIVFTYNKSSEAAVELQPKIEELGVSCLSVSVEIKDFSQCQGLIEKTVDKFSRVDVLINNAGITRDKTLLMMLPDDWREVIDTNLGGVFNMSRAAITTFLKQKEGCIINMGSVSGLIGLAGQTNYSASKAGIIGFSKALAKEVAAYNVRVNVVCPGYINTNMLASLREDLRKSLINNIPCKRIGEPEEVAGLCVFLASGKARYITGEVVKIDGGLAV